MKKTVAAIVCAAFMGLNVPAHAGGAERAEQIHMHILLKVYLEFTELSLRIKMMQAREERMLKEQRGVTLGIRG